MSDISPQQSPEKTIKRQAFLFPLSVKVIAVLICALIPPFALVFLVADLLHIPQVPPSVVRSGIVHVGSFTIPVIYVVVLATFALSLGLGIALAEMLFIHPSRRLLHWLINLRREGFKKIPPLSLPGSDEIGEIGRQLGFAALAFSRGSEESQASMEQRSLFIMTAAHQLRTPLTALLWTIEAVQNPTTSSEERTKLLSSMSESLSRMRLVIEHILASANVEEGRFGFVFEQIDMVSLIEKIILEMRPFSEKQQVQVSFEHDGAFLVFADKERISLALADLLSNALQYTPGGGSVRISLKSEGEKLEVAVADTGIGISEAERAMIFNKFYRSERARHMRPDGSGLGLYLVRNIIEKHGSEITIESTEGKGTRVSFYLHSKRDQFSS